MRNYQVFQHDTDKRAARKPCSAPPGQILAAGSSSGSGRAACASRSAQPRTCGAAQSPPAPPAPLPAQAAPTCWRRQVTRCPLRLPQMTAGGRVAAVQVVSWASSTCWSRAAWCLGRCKGVHALLERAPVIVWVDRQRSIVSMAIIYAPAAPNINLDTSNTMEVSTVWSLWVNRDRQAGGRQHTTYQSFLPPPS